MTKEEFKHITRDMQMVGVFEYIKNYCDGNWSTFQLKTVCVYQCGDAYNDYTYYIDYNNNIVIEDRYYIGD